MNTNWPKNNTPTLYPFRLEEAKLNKGNVVTRDGRAAEYIGDSGAVQWPHAFKVSGAIKPYRYTNNGRFYSDHDEDCDDLFMTTPAPLPAQAPEEPSLEAQTILKLTKQLNRWRSNIRTVVLQGDKTPMDDETLRDRAYTAIDTRVADERRLAKDANSRAESAEARVKVLEEELAEKNAKIELGVKKLEGVLPLAVELEKFVAAHQWIPVSTPPTAEDADERGNVWIPSTRPFHPVGTIHYSNVVPGGYKLWMKPLPLTTPPESEEETERKAAKKAYNKYIEDAPNGRVASFDDFFIGWHAARQSNNKTEA